MLHRTHVQIFALAMGTALAVAACTTKSTDTDIEPNTSGNGGNGATGNEGGDAAGGTGNLGGNGGTGNTGACVGPEDGNGETVDACDDMNITPSCVDGGVASVCNSGGTLFYPEGWRTCHRAFDIFHAGAIGVLVACLDEIGVNPEACESAPVEACITGMYDASCDTNTEANDACDDVNQGCVEAGDDNFDLAGCRSALKPFSTGGVDEYITCQNDHLADACADIHGICLGEVVTYNALPVACDEAPE